ncbi:MAG: hypothetical protein K8L99_17465 [Anaerolineae bacterium]|nr:hypothetical protein [Anaerolineae bacterium]
MDTYTVQLLWLKCVQSQENDGDEIYIKFNGRKVWSTWAQKMHSHPTGIHFDEINFESGRLHQQAGWTPMKKFDASAYRFSGLSGDSMFEVWDANRFLPDDFLGRTPVRAADAEHGHIQAVCARDGAHYVLTYQVLLEH